jgi:hypothetical protein
MPNLPWYVYAMLLAPLAVILFGAVYKSLQVRAASDWPSAPGKVVISNSQVRDVRVIDASREDGFRIEKRNFANIVYEYSVSGERLSNNRVSIDEDRGNFGIAEIIARYPVGKDVTVYYNSRHPRDAVLERDTPKGWWGCLGIGMMIALAIIFGSAFGLNQLTEFVSARLANPKLSPMVVVLGVFGSVLALFAMAMQRGASLAKRWPVVPSTIKMSDVQQYRAAPTRFARGPVMYQQQVSYEYRLQFCRGCSRDRRELAIRLVRAKVHDRLSGRRQRERLRQSRQSVGSDGQSARGMVHLRHSLAGFVRVLVGSVLYGHTQLAFSSEVDTGSREENASK